MSTTPSYREQLVAQLFSLYADLGWAVPTCIENARLTTLEDTIGVALNAVEPRQASAQGQGRAIDRHEDAIVRVLDLANWYDDMPYSDALEVVATPNGLTVERLDSLVRVWCGIAGIKVPS